MEESLLRHLIACFEAEHDFEYIIINLDLSDYPIIVIDWLIGLCKEKRLTTALITLHMNGRSKVTGLFQMLVEIWKQSADDSKVGDILNLKQMDSNRLSW